MTGTGSSQTSAGLCRAEPRPQTEHDGAFYCPPRPVPLSPLGGLLRTLWQGGGDLLSLLPADAYRMEVGRLGYSRRSILLVNAPELVRSVLTDPLDIYPKNDLMVGALAPLVGNSIFVASGDSWRQQRRMVDPAFSHMRLARAFGAMQAAMGDFIIRLGTAGKSGEPISLDLSMSQLTADIICRTVFSASLADDAARDVFHSFAYFERSVAHVKLARLIFGKPFANVPQGRDVLEACNRIRKHLGAMLDSHIAAGATHDDIAASIIGARDPENGRNFTREELIDQLGVFFLAGHETTASALTWALFIAATRPHVTERIRAEVETVVGDGPIEFEHTKRLTFTRNVFKEALRLYPPITFIPRLAAEATRIGPHAVKRGAMIMIAPWTIHRHEKLWKNPHAFDPDRFLPEREADVVPGAYLPFGFGPRVCVGAAFAATEATLILAELVRHFRFAVQAPERVRPVARLTTRPAEEIMIRVTPAQGPRNSRHG